MTGLFELINPLFSAADGLLAWLPVAARILIWGVVAGAGSMAIYARTSPQHRIKRLGDETRARLRSLRSRDPREDASPNEIVQSLGLSLQSIGAALGPALLASLPVLFMVGYLNATYGLQDPVPGEPVAVLTDDANAIVIPDGQKFAAGWTVNWPKDDEVVQVLDASGQPIYAIEADTHPGTARKGGLMALIFGAPAGKLAAAAPVGSLKVATPAQSIVQPGLIIPYQWAIPFFAAVLLSSLLIKFTFRIS